MRSHRLAAPAVAVVVTALALIFAVMPSGSTAPGAKKAAAVPSCTKPTSNVTSQKLANYMQCLSRREEALLANLKDPAPTVTETTTTTVTVPGPTVTETVTVTAEPTPTPTPDPEPEPEPEPSGFPNASNTGVPAGTTLTAYTGPMRITTAGTTIDAKRITGSLTIAAANVTVKRSSVNGSIGVDSGNLVVEDTRIDVGNQPGTGLGEINYVARRVHITGGNRGANCYDGCTIRDSYIHGQFNDPTNTYHMSGLRMGMNTNYVGNTIECDDGKTGDASGCSAALTGYGDFSPVQNNLIQGNLIKATPAWYCAYGGSSASKPYASQARDIRFIDNVFERGATGSCGRGWAVTDFVASRPGNVWSGNTWDDGRPVNP